MGEVLGIGELGFKIGRLSEEQQDNICSCYVPLPHLHGFVLLPVPDGPSAGGQAGQKAGGRPSGSVAHLSLNKSSLPCLAMPKIIIMWFLSDKKEWQWQPSF